MNTSNKEAGFTLIEIIIVVVILALLAVIAIPSYSSFIKHRKLVGLSEEAYHDIGYARSEAISSGKDTTLNIKVGSSWCYGVTAKDSCNCSQADSCEIAQVDSHQYPGVFMSAAGITSGSLHFSQSRGAINEAASLEFQMDDSLIRIDVNKQGYASICKTGSIGDYKECE